MSVNGKGVPESQPPKSGGPTHDRTTLALELSKVIVPVIGTIIAACLSGVFLVLNNSGFFHGAASATPILPALTETFTPAPPTATFLPSASLTSVASNTVTPAPSPTATELPWKSFFRDDFSNPKSGWLVIDSPGGIQEYIEGGYQFTFKKGGTVTLAYAPLGQPLTDVRVETDAIQLAGGEPWEISLVCRLDSKTDGFYDLGINGQNGVKKYGIYRWLGPNYDTLAERIIDDPTLLNTGKIANHLRADCVGDTLTLYVNGRKLVEAKDDTFKTGRVGVLSGYSEGVKAFFDNFAVYKP